MEFRLQQVLRKAGERVRETYYECCNSWHLENERRVTKLGKRANTRYDGGVDDRGVTHANVWDKIALLAYQNRIPPVSFVKAQFLIRWHEPPYPNYFLSQRALDIYGDSRENNAGALLRIFQAQKECFVTEVKRISQRKLQGWSDQHLAMTALANCLLRLSALFRYCVARREGFLAIADCFWQEAMEQYLDHVDDYDAVWQGWIPDELRQAVAQLAQARFVPGQEAFEQASGEVTGPTPIFDRPLILVD